MKIDDTIYFFSYGFPEHGITERKIRDLGYYVWQKEKQQTSIIIEVTDYYKEQDNNNEAEYKSYSLSETETPNLYSYACYPSTFYISTDKELIVSEFKKCLEYKLKETKTKLKDLNTIKKELNI